MHLEDVLNEVINENLNKLIISNPKMKSYEFTKMNVRLINLRSNIMVQFEKYTKTQVLHENVSMDEAVEKILLYSEYYKQMDIYTATHSYTVKMKDVSDVHVSKKKLDKPVKIVIEGQNKEKNYLLKEGMNIPALVDLGVFTKDFKVVNTKYDKYRQLNRFIEIIDDVISKEDKDFYHIVDFGCGKSYLTFVVYYYFTAIKHKKVKVVGMDLKESVIAHCNEVAKKYHYDHLTFIAGDIKDYVSDEPIDMMVTLHACDVATDIAMFHAIRTNARLLFSVPCCQHELNAKIQNDTMNLVLKHGILKDRISAIYTDAMRASLLEACGYNVNMLEYVDDEGSLKNILIRANKTKISEAQKEKILSELHELEEMINGKCMLHKLLESNKLL